MLVAIIVDTWKYISVVFDEGNTYKSGVPVIWWLSCACKCKFRNPECNQIIKRFDIPVD